MTLEERIKADLNVSLKQGDKGKVSILRMILSAIKNKKIEEGSDVLADAGVIGIMQKMARQHKESIEQFSRAGRNDLVDKEAEELKALESYLPEALAGDELDRIISDAIAGKGATSIRDMGIVMRVVMDKTAGRADGKVVSEKVREALNAQEGGENGKNV